ncbi:DUF3054 domain-containing protein [Actinotalea sp. M2MS4P-6]|uniref:DUF3054 domain-containing protein n=1 Tax=Actinotalea sp. M2MS4P-6 TaxID=2983762 RepID=UPI0021E4662C|nr:DUF3054 domain-containing protein [Actinotalea sp. M2MS4P-6]MCV2392679.1 DUF3054 domain-containing protein [Actinotalea sp. M2MS4P-6]
MSAEPTASSSHRVAAGPSDPAAFGVDVASVLVFVLLGRRSHDEGSAVLGTLSTAWPFLLGAGIGWVGLLLVRRAGGRQIPGRSFTAGSVVLVDTVVVGMLLRALTRDTPPLSFIVVATTFLGLFLLGWRAAAAWWAARAARA